MEYTIKQIEDNIYKVSRGLNEASVDYCRTYEEALYCVAFGLVGDTSAHESLESFHTTLKMALNKEFQGNLGDRICFKGRFFYPSHKYVSKIQSKVKYLKQL